MLAGMNKGEANRQQPAEASSFDQVFKQKSEPKVETTYANGKPVPIEKDVNRGIPDKGENPNVQSGTTRDEPRMVSKEKNNWDDSGSVSKSRENSERVKMRMRSRQKRDHKRRIKSSANNNKRC